MEEWGLLGRQLLELAPEVFAERLGFLMRTAAQSAESRRSAAQWWEFQASPTLH